MNENKELTNEQIDAIAKAAEEANPEEVVDVRKIEVEPSEDIEAAEIVTDIDGISAIDIIAQEVETMPNSDISLFDIGNDEVKDAIVKQKATDSIAESLNLSDDDAIQILDIVSSYKKDPEYKVYQHMPKELKDMVRQIAFSNNLNTAAFEDIARMMIDEFVKSAEVEEAFIDLETSLNSALNMPSIVDLYTDHTRSVMEEHIPKTIEAIKDEYPDKAAMLEGVKKSFTDGYTFEVAKKMYEENARFRKTLRRHDTMIKRTLEEMNFRNEKSNFKMNDARELPIVLHHVLIEEPEIICSHYPEGEDLPEHIQRIADTGINGADIEKFCILICKSCEGRNPDDVVDASYMYYMLKNIIVLKHSNEAKTDFAVELINNICDTIAFIRSKEAAFNESKVSERGDRKQRH